MSLDVSVYMNGKPVTEKWTSISEGEIREIVSGIIREGAYQIVNLAMAKVPVKTGRLKASIRMVPHAEGAIVEASAPYALPVEQGHVTRSGSWVPGVFFIRDSVEQVIPEINRQIEDEINQYLKEREK